MKKRTVIYIAGAAHSGSTFLDIMLGEAEGALSLGQLGEIYNFIDDDGAIRLQQMNRLPAWEKFFERLTGQERLAIKNTAQMIRREKPLLSFLFFSRNKEKYLNMSTAMFDEIFLLNPDRNVFIDSSKNICRALALREAKTFDVYVVHLIRDCRGYINSSRKRAGNNKSKRSITKNMAYWLTKNISASMFLKMKFRQRYILIRYEDLIEHPLRELQKISDCTRVDIEKVLAVIAGKAKFTKKQLLGGNAIRTLDTISLDRSKLLDSIPTGYSNFSFWISGGFLSKFWNYNFRQDYSMDRKRKDRP